MPASSLFKSLLFASLAIIGVSCGSKLKNSADPLNVECGLSSNEALENNLWVFKVFSDGQPIPSKDLELYRIASEGIRSSDGLGTTSHGCVTLNQNKPGETILVNLPSTSQPQGIRYDLPDQHPLGSYDKVIPLVVLPYGNQPFDVWSQCGEFEASSPLQKTSVVFKIVNRTTFDIPLSSFKASRQSNNAVTEISVSRTGCFVLDGQLDGTLIVTDPSGLTYAEQSLNSELIPGNLYPIYLTPAPTDEQKCLKRGIQWKWQSESCQLKNFQDFCEKDRDNDQLKPAFEYLAESLGSLDCKTLEEKILGGTSFTVLERKNLSNALLLQGFDHFEIVKMGQNRIFDLAPFRNMNQLKELYLQSNKVSDLSYLPPSAPLQILALWDNDLSSLAGVERYPGLRELYAQNNQIADIKNIAGLTKLKMVYLSDNRISDISVLTNMGEIEELYMAYNRLQDLKPIAGLKTLKKLTLSFNQIQDISSLADLTNMEVLYLWGNKVSDLSPLSKMAKLQTIYLSDNRVTDISPLADITTLDLFYAPDNKISDITILGNQKKIRFINLINNPITDLSPLKELENLQELKVSGTPIDSDVALSAMKCPLDAKSKVLKDYCAKRVQNPDAP
ncbi:MAG: leucine-rich repeat domain-containing protein [Pseudobdellovibrionaceae bacterium]|nr:leucine-rich repeat domain-containing protein [Pseudobdellovibrionaceae bacterium]